LFVLRLGILFSLFIRPSGFVLRSFFIFNIFINLYVHVGRRFRRPSCSRPRRCGPLPVRPEPGVVSKLPALRQRVAGRLRTTGLIVVGRGGLQRQRRPLLRQQPV